jgi:GalNAc-alpha-(1->4)-GalNAc-alpha-(1->3)-diNAcBac-PP-undecaprenol alpha-1,4-N-acetyl-D-galactosaminyltransferase
MTDDQQTILIAAGGLAMGGLERVAANVSNYYAQKGWNVILVNLLNPKEKVFQTIDPRIHLVFFHDISENPSFVEKVFCAPRWTRFLRQTIAQFHPSVVFALTFKIASLAVKANKKKHLRVVARELNDPKSVDRPWYVNFMTDHYVRHADAVIFQTQWEKSCYSKRVQSIGYVVPNPVRSVCDAPEKKRPVIVTACRIENKQKRLDLLIRSFEIFHQTHPQYTLEIYGEGPDQGINESLATSLGIQDSVIFKGPQKNVISLIQDASIFAISSDYEGMSNALLEAWLSGIPSVSTDWPGVREIISDDVDGLIAKRDDPFDLARCLSRLADHPDEALAMAQVAKTHFSEYEYSTIMEKYRAVIEGRVK